MSEPQTSLSMTSTKKIKEEANLDPKTKVSGRDCYSER